MKVKGKSLSRVRLFVTPWTVAHQAVLSMGFSRQEYWSGLPFPSPGHLPDPGIKPKSPTLQADALTSEPPGNVAEKARVYHSQCFGHQGMKLALMFILREASSYSYIPCGCSTYYIFTLRLQHKCHPTKALGCLQARHSTAQAETLTNNILYKSATFSNNDISFT